MKLLIIGLLAGLVGCATASINNFSCDPVQGAAFYTVYVANQTSTNTITYSTNSFLAVPSKSKDNVWVTATTSDGWESDPSNILTNPAAPVNLKKK